MVGFLFLWGIWERGALFEGEKNFFQNFWIGVLGFLVFWWGFFIVDVEIYWIIVLTYVFALRNM